MAQELQPGEHVSWNYGAGQAKGQVVERLTENKKLGSRVFKASPDEPKYLVKSDTSGKEAIKKPETLHKIDEADAQDADNSSAPTEYSDGTPTEPTQDERTSAESDATRQEVGAKEKRDGFKQRSSKEEKIEADLEEESSKKVVDSGMGSPRASAIAAKGKREEVSEVLGAAEEEAGISLYEGEREYTLNQPKKGELETADEVDDGPVDLPELIAQVNEEAKEEGTKDGFEKGTVEDDEADVEDHIIKAEEDRFSSHRD